MHAHYDRIIDFNGKIYHYLELGERLANRHIFGTASDAEVIPAAFQACGEAFVEHFIGMLVSFRWIFL